MRQQRGKYGRDEGGGGGFERARVHGRESRVPGRIPPGYELHETNKESISKNEKERRM